LRSLVARLVLHARLVLVEEGVADLNADLVLGKHRRSSDESEGNQHGKPGVLHSSPSAHLPSSILMMPEKSFAAWPPLTKSVNSWAALAPSGVLAPTALAACWASSRSFSIIAAVKPAW